MHSARDADASDPADAKNVVAYVWIRVRGVILPPMGNMFSGGMRTYLIMGLGVLAVIFLVVTLAT